MADCITRLATFKTWPYQSPSLFEMAGAGFIYTPRRSLPDLVKCTTCRTLLDEWKPADNFIEEHTRHSPNFFFLVKRRKIVELMAQEAIEDQKAEELAKEEAIEATKPNPTVQELAVFDPTLQQDFVELRLFHDVDKFTNLLQQLTLQYRSQDVLQLLPKCLRGPANTWYQTQADVIDLPTVLQSLVKEFKMVPTPTPQIATPQKVPQLPPQQYHTCAQCSAQYSSISRLLRHSQEDRCGKATCSCKHCEQTFSSNKQLHKHLRTGCGKSTLPSVSKGKVAHKLALQRPIIAESSPSAPSAIPATPVYKRPATPVRQQYSTPPAVPSPPAAPLLTYRSTSPSPPSYESPKAYMTINDLFIRYAPLKSIHKTSEKSGSATAKIQPISLINLKLLPQQRHQHRAAPIYLTIEDLKKFEKSGPSTKQGYGASM